MHKHHGQEDHTGRQGRGGDRAGDIRRAPRRSFDDVVTRSFAAEDAFDDNNRIVELGVHAPGMELDVLVNRLSIVPEVSSIDFALASLNDSGVISSFASVAPQALIASMTSADKGGVMPFFIYTQTSV